MINKLTAGLGLILSLAAMGCSSKSNIKDVETKLENSQNVGNETLGKNSEGKYILQNKENLVTHLLDLQRDVHGMEEGIYGNKAYGNKGKYGVLEDCRIELRAKNVKKWEMVDPAPKSVLSKEEAKISKKMALDEKGQLIMLTEEELGNRISRFERYKESYEKQDDWFDTEIKSCKIGLKN